jgi:glutamyl-tRNA synthetase
MAVRTRFAPSPTGFLHLGNVRTALYAWLYAKRYHGKFILRIEDTDPERSKPEYIDALLDDLRWLQINYDEGPYYQSKRFNRYKEVAHQLIKEGKAYRCYCSKERLQSLREDQIRNKQKPRYDGRCRELDAPQNTPFVVRFKNPSTGVVKFHDLIHGDLSFQNSELDDVVLLREDGIPTYNFAVVVDDLDMNITHVTRGDDHINNTPRQINIFNALDAEPPQYAHLSSILGNDGKRLSKRHGAISALQLREEGFLPEALVNYLARLGWSHGDQEIFSHDELKKLFDLAHVHKSAATFDKNKLVWLNQHYLKSLPPHRVAEELKWHMNKLNIHLQNGPDLEEVTEAQAERCKTLNEMAERSRFLFEDFQTYDEKSAKKHLKKEAGALLQSVLGEFKTLKHWERMKLHDIILSTADKFQLKLNHVAQPIRVALTGITVSPPIDLTLYLVGREKTLARIERAIQFINNPS